MLDYMTTEICEGCNKAFTLRSNEEPTYLDDIDYGLEFEAIACRDSRTEETNFDSADYLLQILKLKHNL